MKVLIISKTNIDNIDKDKFHVTKNIGEEYNCRSVNPPFFKKIIILDTDIVDYDLKRIYNMLLVNGKLYFPKKYKIFFESLNTILTSENSSMLHCIKPNNKIFTFPSKRIVEFIIMGVQRGGTTSLAKNLSLHKDIFLNGDTDPRKSEIHYFDLNWHKCNDWYKKKFDYKKQLVGDKTPDLFNLTSTFPLIQKINPFVKLIIVLKDPILRAFSAWKMMTAYFGENRSFEECIKGERKIKNKTFYNIATQYLERGLYYKQLKELGRWFPKQNILVLISDEVEVDTDKEYRKIYEFLNIDYVKNKYLRIHASTNEETLDKKTYDSLKSYFQDDVLKLEKYIGKKLNWLQ
jgi:hypothetical protein